MSRKTILSVIALAIAAVIALSLCSCQSEYDDPKYSDLDFLYSRGYIDSVKDEAWFATSRDGYIDAALAFFYHNSDISLEYGDEFDCKPEDIGSSSEGTSIMGVIWDGQSKVHISIKDSIYEITLKKDYFDRKWYVETFKKM